MPQVLPSWPVLLVVSVGFHDAVSFWLHNSEMLYRNLRFLVFVVLPSTGTGVWSTGRRGLRDEEMLTSLQTT